MTEIFPRTASSQQIQRHYRSYFNYVIENKQPLLVLNNNKPEVVVIDLETYKDMKTKLISLEQDLAKLSVKFYSRQKSKDQLKNFQPLSLSSDEN